MSFRFICHLRNTFAHKENPPAPCLVPSFKLEDPHSKLSLDVFDHEELVQYPTLVAKPNLESPDFLSTLFLFCFPDRNPDEFSLACTWMLPHHPNPILQVASQDTFPLTNTNQLESSSPWNPDTYCCQSGGIVYTGVAADNPKSFLHPTLQSFLKVPILLTKSPSNLFVLEIIHQVDYASCFVYPSNPWSLSGSLGI